MHVVPNNCLEQLYLSASQHKARVSLALVNSECSALCRWWCDNQQNSHEPYHLNHDEMLYRFCIWGNESHTYIFCLHLWQKMLIQKDILGQWTIRKEKCQRQLFSLVFLWRKRVRFRHKQSEIVTPLIRFCFLSQLVRHYVSPGWARRLFSVDFAWVRIRASPCFGIGFLWVFWFSLWSKDMNNCELDAPKVIPYLWPKMLG